MARRMSFTTAVCADGRDRHKTKRVSKHFGLLYQADLSIKLTMGDENVLSDRLMH